MKLGYNYLVQHHLLRGRNAEISRLYIITSIRSFMTSMIGIFIPIYLYRAGFSLSDIILLNIFQFSFEFIFEFFAAPFVARYGPKHSIALSMPLLILHFWMLSTINQFGWPLWVVALPASMALAFYWQSYHYDFSRAKHASKATREISRIYVILAFLGAIAPFVGGIIATNFGMGFLYSMVLLVLFLMIPLLVSSSEPHIRRKFNFSLRRFMEPEYLRQRIAYGGMGIEASAAAVFWPIFVFLVVGTYQNVGFVTSFALLITVLTTYYVGKSADLKGKTHYIKAGSLINGLIAFIRAAANTITHILFLNIAGNIAHAFFNSPFVAEYYLHADEEKRLEYIFLMEASIDVARVFLFVILYAISLFLSVKATLIIGLIGGGLGSLLIGLMPATRKEEASVGAH